jgi:hypothetical protein
VDLHPAVDETGAIVGNPDGIVTRQLHDDGPMVG